MGAVASIVNEVFAPTVRVEDVIMTRDDGHDITSITDEDGFSEVDIVLESDRSVNQKSEVSNESAKETTNRDNENSMNQSSIINEEEKDENGNTKYTNLESIIEKEIEEKTAEKNTLQFECTYEPHALNTRQSEYTEESNALSTGRFQYTEESQELNTGQFEQTGESHALNTGRFQHIDEIQELNAGQFEHTEESQKQNTGQVEHTEESQELQNWQMEHTKESEEQNTRHFKHTEESQELNIGHFKHTEEIQTLNSSGNRRQIRPTSYVVHSNNAEENYDSIEKVWNKDDKEDSGHITEPYNESVLSLVANTRSNTKDKKVVHKTNDKTKIGVKRGRTSDNHTINVKSIKAKHLSNDRTIDHQTENGTNKDSDDNQDDAVLENGKDENDEENMQEGSQSTDIDTVRDLDDYAKQVPKSVLCSFKDLLEYFEKPLQDSGNREELLIRSFLIWLGGLDIPGSKHQPIKDIAQNDTRSPDELMNLLRKNLNAYTASEIQCTRIKGISRTGDCDDITKSEWVTVYINNKWKIVHPYRICLALSGKLTKRMLKVTGGEITEDDVNMLRESFLDHYIFAKPEWFIYEYYPDDPAWQLMFEPITEEHFWKQELFYHPWWDLGLRLTNKRQHALTSDSGRITITLDGTNESSNDLVVWYDFSLMKGDPSGSKNVKYPDHEYLQRLVMLIRNKSSFVCNILLPVEGQYKIVFYGGKSIKALLAICEFDINCSQCYSDPILLPINPGMACIGPGLATNIAGLIHTFPTNGLIHLDIGKTTKLRSSVGYKMSAKFMVKADVMPFVTDIEQDVSNHLYGLTECTLTKKGEGQGVLITVKSPESPGHYLLEIKTSLNGSTWSAACYYVLIYKPVKVVVLERCSQKMARKELQNATEMTDGNHIMISIQECITKRIDGNDPEIQKGRGRIANLKKANQKKKKLVFNEVHPHETLLMFNIIRQREYERYLHELYKYLRDFNNYLTSVYSSSPGEVPDMDGLTHEEKHVILIVLTLFGRTADEGKTSMEQMQDILIELNGIGMVLKAENIKKTATIIDKFTQSEVKYVNFAAGRVFSVVHDIVCWMARA